MKYLDYLNLIDLIKENYTKADSWFTEFRIKEYYEYLRYYPLEPFKKLLKEFMSNSPYLPTLNDIRSFCKNIEREKTEEEIKVTNCVLCSNTGRVSLYKKDDLSAWCFRCGCPHGQKYSNNFPLRPSEFEINYFTLDQYQNAILERDLFRRQNKEVRE